MRLIYEMHLNIETTMTKTKTEMVFSDKFLDNSRVFFYTALTYTEFPLRMPFRMQF